MTVKDRIKTYCKAENITVSAFEKAIGASNGYVNNISRSIGLDYLNALIEKYSNLNIEWLLTGKGDMLRSSAPINPAVPTSPTPQFSELISTITQQAEEIGRLKARIAELERRRGDNAPDAQSGNVAHAG